MESKLFTEAEIKALEKKLKNKSFKDTTGIYYGRVRPKLRELFDYWFKKRKELVKLIEVKDGKK